MSNNPATSSTTENSRYARVSGCERPSHCWAPAMGMTRSWAARPRCEPLAGGAGCCSPGLILSVAISAIPDRKAEYGAGLGLDPSLAVEGSTATFLPLLDDHQHHEALPLNACAMVSSSPSSY